MATKNNNARSNSRFKDTAFILTKDGQETYGLTEGLDSLRVITGDQLEPPYKVPNSMEGRPDLIANLKYQNSHLEWIIVLANRPRNTVGWPRAGDIIKIPKKSFVRTIT